MIVHAQARHSLSAVLHSPHCSLSSWPPVVYKKHPQGPLAALLSAEGTIAWCLKSFLFRLLHGINQPKAPCSENPWQWLFFLLEVTANLLEAHGVLIFLASYHNSMLLYCRQMPGAVRCTRRSLIFHVFHMIDFYVYYSRLCDYLWEAEPCSSCPFISGV